MKKRLPSFNEWVEQRLKPRKFGVTYWEDLSNAEQAAFRQKRAAELDELFEMEYPFNAKFANEDVMVLGPQSTFLPEPDGRIRKTQWVRAKRLDGSKFDTLASSIFVDGSPLITKSPSGRVAQTRPLGFGSDLGLLRKEYERLKAAEFPCKLYSLQDEAFEGLEEDFEKDPWDIVEEAERLFAANGIRISSYEELYEACIDTTGKVLGSSVAGSPGQGLDEGDPRINIRFSVAVAPEARRQGIAKALIESIMAAYPSDDFLLEAWVVNPHMVTLLQRLGFEEDGEWTPDNPFMRRPRRNPQGRHPSNRCLRMQ